MTPKPKKKKPKDYGEEEEGDGRKRKRSRRASGVERTTPKKRPKPGDPGYDPYDFSSCEEEEEEETSHVTKGGVAEDEGMDTTESTAAGPAELAQERWVVLP